MVCGAACGHTRRTRDSTASGAVRSAVCGAAHGVAAPGAVCFTACDAIGWTARCAACSGADGAAHGAARRADRDAAFCTAFSAADGAAGCAAHGAD